MKTNVYVDGFNLYYGLLKGVPNRKWLDLAKLTALIQPKESVNRIRYFTALVSARPSDPQEPQRQQTYLRALRTIPNLTIHLGQYRTHVVRMRLANPPSRPSSLDPCRSTIELEPMDHPLAVHQRERITLPDLRERIGDRWHAD